MRNENYYKSVVKEFFPKDIEKYKMVINSDSGFHECFCNLCGVDLA
jgi:hypothetical protein